ncbi:YaaR family protein [Bacillus marinisedimentorum]|uniref:YaaR family protein n=1 Tax=Bacillus marinisedimentorum TaxID=1821260 RepID=UPI000872AE0B|nr:YaaR family protein [Bacillus marinisedimentorum]
MKINHELRPRLENSRPEANRQQPSSASFGKYVQNHGEKLQLEQLNMLMADIEKQGARLVRSRNFQDLARYKNMVKQFLKEAVNSGLDLKKSNSWNGQGHRTLTIVEQVDEQLSALTDEVLMKEQKSIDLLDRIGEIKGLLVNLYT